jgi:hypothetical protein
VRLTDLLQTTPDTFYEQPLDTMQEGYCTKWNDLRYNPRMRLKLREVDAWSIFGWIQKGIVLIFVFTRTQAFSTLDQLYQSGVIISNLHVSSVIKHTLNFDFTLDVCAKYVDHFSGQPRLPRDSGSRADDKRKRYDSFAEDLWLVILCSFTSVQVC